MIGDIQKAIASWPTRQAIDDYVLAAGTGDNAAVADFLDHYAKAVDNTSKDGVLALFCAAKNGHKSTVELLLDRGADINIRGNAGFTVLMFAALGKSVEVVEFLLDKGVSIDDTSGDGRTALMWAASCPDTEEVIELLLDRGASSEKKSNMGLTALAYAVQYPHTAAVAKCIEQWPEKKVRLKAQKELTAEFADFSPGLKKDVVVRPPLKFSKPRP